MAEVATTPTKEVKEKVKKDPKVLEAEHKAKFQAKVKVLVAQSKKKADNEERKWILESAAVPKLTKTEWDNLVTGKLEGFEGTKVSQAFMDECIKMGLMVTYKAKAPKAPGEGKPRMKMYMNSEDGKVKSAGTSFESAFATFLTSQEANVKVLSDAGYAFQPFWRNMNEKGKHGTKVQTNTSPEPVRDPNAKF